MTAADGKQRLSCDLARGRAVLIGATHVDALDSHVTPLGAMAGVDILANTLLGVRWMAQSDPPRGLPASALWGAILFLACVAAGRAFSAEAATVLIAVGLLIFAIASGYAGLDAATAIAAIKTSLLMYGFYLLASAILAKLLKMLRARRLARARAQSTTQELLP
jgi:CHASE2 domain-containing sensor protein